MDSPTELVARFLRANNYHEVRFGSDKLEMINRWWDNTQKTLAAFVKEAGLPADSGSLEAGALTVEQIVREKQLFDLSLKFEKIDVDERNSSWTSPGIYSQISVDIG